MLFTIELWVIFLVISIILGFVIALQVAVIKAQSKKLDNEEFTAEIVKVNFNDSLQKYTDFLDTVLRFIRSMEQMEDGDLHMVVDNIKDSIVEFTEYGMKPEMEKQVEPYKFEAPNKEVGDTDAN